MFLLNGSPLPLDTAFVVNDVQYPANWLRLASLEEKEAIGITEVADPVRPDDRYYWVSQNPDGSFTSTAKDLEAVRVMRAQELRATAYSLLAPTDYKLIRHVETGEAVDATTTAKRAAIRASFVANQTALDAAATVEEIAALNFTWPQD